MDFSNVQLLLTERKTNSNMYFIKAAPGQEQSFWDTDFGAMFRERKASGVTQNTLTVDEQLESTKQEVWNDLLEQLRKMQLVNEDAYEAARSKDYPKSYTDTDGNEVRYEITPEIEAELNKEWPGNPLQYLDDRAFTLRKWSAYLSLGTNEYGDGYDTSLIDRQANLCAGVAEVLRGLSPKY